METFPEDSTPSFYKGCASHQLIRLTWIIWDYRLFSNAISWHLHQYLSLSWQGWLSAPSFFV